MPGHFGRQAVSWRSSPVVPLVPSGYDLAGAAIRARLAPSFSTAGGKLYRLCRRGPSAAPARAVFAESRVVSGRSVYGVAVLRAVRSLQGSTARLFFVV